MSEANQLLNPNKKHIAVIGDGAMTAGMAFEALSHMGHLKSNILVILNDNDMSISENIGGLSNYFSRIWASKIYKGIKKSGASFLKPLPQAYHLARKAETQMKALVAPGTMFEELGLNYIGPIDGHNIKELKDVISNLKDFEGPQFLHVITKKGAGLDPAEADRIGFHAIGKINAIKQEKSDQKKYKDIFSDWILDMAKKDNKLIGITPAMREGSGLVKFSKEFPDRYYDVAIAEQHSVTLAAGLACEGKKPIVAIYSTFLQRAYDQVVHDVAIQSLPVRFAIDRAGLVGADGPTHAGSFDITYLSTLPNFVVMAASDESELVKMINTSVDINDKPSAFRYPRGNGFGVNLPNISERLEIGKGRIIKEGKNVAIINFGARLNECLIARENLFKKGIKISVMDARFAKPLDENLLWQIATDHEVVITIEEGSIGGFGSHVAQFLNEKNLLDSKLKFRSMFLPDTFINHDKPDFCLLYTSPSPRDS